MSEVSHQPPILSLVGFFSFGDSSFFLRLLFPFLLAQVTCGSSRSRGRLLPRQPWHREAETVLTGPQPLPAAS